MYQDCPACGEDDCTFDYVEGTDKRVCECEVCKARFEVDPDYDWNGDRWTDCSTPGRRIRE